MIYIDEKKMQEYFDNQDLHPKIVEAMTDLSSATGMDAIDTTQNFFSCVHGNDDALKAYGIDPTGVSGFYERINFLIAEINKKFTVK